jgi:NADPH:quinone reductase-like Zn-dependent oxidoreductase
MLMEAVIYTNYGSPEVLHLAEIETPTPQADEVLIKVHASSVTSRDGKLRGFVYVKPEFKLMMRFGFGFWKPKRPVLGVEFAGEVAAIGRNVTQFKIGDKVFGVDGTRFGAYAQYKTIPENAGIAHMPKNLTFEEAVVLPNGALTSLTFLRDVANIQHGQRVLINGASGSVGSAAVQLAKYYGAEVTGVCSAKNMDLVKSLGADHVIDYTQENFWQRGETYDIIFDPLGKTLFSDCKSVLEDSGQYLTATAGFREFLQMGWTGLFGQKKVKAGFVLDKQDDLLLVKELVESGKVHPLIDRTYPLEQIVEAHWYVDAGHKRGNVVITIS